jgi:predicted nucleic acid-binding protein
MAIRVVDASALGALLFGEPEGAAVADRLRHVDLIAPTLLSFEIAGICLKKMRRYPDQRDRLMAAFATLEPMQIGVVEVDHGETIMLAEQSGLTSYDASYLWLARKTGAELVTLDRQLEAAVANLR